MLVARFLWLLHAPRIARFGVDGSAVEVVGAGGEDSVDVVRVLERDKAKAPGTTRFAVLHDDAVDDAAKTFEISQ